MRAGAIAALATLFFLVSACSQLPIRLDQLESALNDLSTQVQQLDASSGSTPAPDGSPSALSSPDSSEQPETLPEKPEPRQTTVDAPSVDAPSVPLTETLGEQSERAVVSKPEPASDVIRSEVDQAPDTPEIDQRPEVQSPEAIQPKMEPAKATSPESLEKSAIEGAVAKDVATDIEASSFAAEPEAPSQLLPDSSESSPLRPESADPGAIADETLTTESESISEVVSLETNNSPEFPTQLQELEMQSSDAIQPKLAPIAATVSEGAGEPAAETAAPGVNSQKNPSAAVSEASSQSSPDTPTPSPLAADAAAVEAIADKTIKSKSEKTESEPISVDIDLETVSSSELPERPQETNVESSDAIQAKLDPIEAAIPESVNNSAAATTAAAGGNSQESSSAAEIDVAIEPLPETSDLPQTATESAAESMAQTQESVAESTPEPDAKLTHSQEFEARPVFDEEISEPAASSTETLES